MGRQDNAQKKAHKTPSQSSTDNLPTTTTTTAAAEDKEPFQGVEKDAGQNDQQQGEFNDQCNSADFRKHQQTRKKFFLQMCGNG